MPGVQELTRSQRTRHQVNYPETYDLIFQRVRSELQAAARSGQPIKHLILLLGIPIAYPVRLLLVTFIHFLSREGKVGTNGKNHHSA